MSEYSWSSTWFRFYDAAWELILKMESAGWKLGACPYGTKCFEDGYACCDHNAHGQQGTTGLPHEEKWMQRAKHQNVSLFDAMPTGCRTCGTRKTIVCGLWPVLPAPSLGREWGVNLLFQCEALIMEPKSYIPHVRVASSLAKLIVDDFPELISPFNQEMDFIVSWANGPNLRARELTAARLLEDEMGPRMVRTLMAYEQINGISKDAFLKVKPLYDSPLFEPLKDADVDMIAGNPGLVPVKNLVRIK